jgi:hypothetical protein
LSPQGLVKLDVGKRNNHVAANGRRKKGLGEVKKVFSNKDLPAGCLDQDRWRKWFITTYIWWVAHLDDVWNINCMDACDALQILWDTIFSKVIPYDVSVSRCAVYSVVRILVLGFCHL